MTKNKLYQYNTLASLMAGLYSGTLTIGELVKRGNMGIGTVDLIDGELIVLDGKAYQARGDKTITELSDDVLVPYAAVIDHIPYIQEEIDETTDSEKLAKRMEELFGSQNLFKSIKMHGTFKKMHVRMITTAENGTRFADVAANQPEFIEEDVTGTIVGIWTPEMFHGVSVAGFHLHFLSDDHSFGGHILDYVMKDGQLEIGQVHELIQDFPTENEDFLKAEFDLVQLRKDIDVSE